MAIGYLFSSARIFAESSVELSGDALSIALPTVAAGMTLALKDRTGTWEFAESFGVTMAVTYTLKYTVTEARPSGSGRSFPSGHTSASFSAAEFVRKRYGWEYGIPAYALASYVGYTRVEAGAHHPHDVVAGAGIGILSSYIFTRRYHGWKAEIEGDTRSVCVGVCRDW